ncbi:MAG: DUF4402 domain-containing protein [Sphingomicrobium sp.]
MRPSARAIIAGTFVAWALCAAQPAVAATQVAKVSAAVAKPLSLTRVQDLDLGSIVTGPGTWSGAVVGISRAGAFSCTNSNVTCTGATSVAKYTVTGSNNQAVRITAPNVTLTNQSDPTKTLLLTVDAPASVTLPNSGNQGVEIPIGGSITVSSATSGGTYSGTFNVTVDY